MTGVILAARKDLTEEGYCQGTGHAHRGQACGNPYLHMVTGDMDERNPQEIDKSSPEFRTYRRRR